MESLKVIEKHFSKKLVRIYLCGSPDAPVFFCSMFQENGQELLKACKQAGASDFHLVSIANIDWDEDLSPWEHGPVVMKDDHFTGQAPAYLAWIEQEVVPFVSQYIDHPAYMANVGYSMAGLFAVWSLYSSTLFEKAGCVSGSLWYPGFYEFASTHALMRKPEAVYFSIGDKECNGSNPALRTTQSTMEKMAALFAAQGIDTTFVLNPGNHFQHSAARLAKAILWLLQNPNHTA